MCIGAYSIEKWSLCNAAVCAAREDDECANTLSNTVKGLKGVGLLGKVDGG